MATRKFSKSGLRLGTVAFQCKAAYSITSHAQDRARDAFKDMLDSVNKTPFSEAVRVLCDNIQLDPHFKDFYTWTLQNNIPVIVLSSGMVDVIRALLVHLVGPEANKIQIISNDVQDRPGMNREQPGGWEIKFHDGRFVNVRLIGLSYS